MRHRLGILAVYFQPNRLEELSYYQKLSVYGNQLGVQVEVFTPEDVQSSKKVRVRVYDARTKKWTRKLTSLPPLIYDRCRYHGQATYRLLKAFRQKYPHLNYLSKPLANKWRMHHLLVKHPKLSAYLPPTQKYESCAQLISFIQKHKIVFAKPKNGTGGRGIIRLQQVALQKYRIEGRNQHRTILPIMYITEKDIKQKVHALGLQTNYIIQKGISSTLADGRVHDFRMLIQKNDSGHWEITGCVGRVGPQRSVTSNLHGGGVAIRMEKLLLSRFESKEKVHLIKQRLEQFAYHLANCLEEEFGMLCELGADIAIDPQGRIWLLEVNPKPSREVFRRIGSLAAYRTAIKRPLEYARWLFNQEKKAKLSSMPLSSSLANPLSSPQSIAPVIPYIE